MGGDSDNFLSVVVPHDGRPTVAGESRKGELVVDVLIGLPDFHYATLDMPSHKPSIHLPILTLYGVAVGEDRFGEREVGVAFKRRSELEAFKCGIGAVGRQAHRSDIYNWMTLYANDPQRHPSLSRQFYR